MPSGQVDDDTALINSYGKKILINTDVLVEGIHFSDATTSPEDVGWKAIMANVSDLASSGVEEILGITVGMITPANTQWFWIENLYNGMQKALKKYGGNIIGGDCSCGQQKVIAISAIGTLGKLHLHRSNAIDGDCLIASGPHGLSRLGLALLLSDPLANKNKLSKTLKEKAINAHKRPEAPIDALQALISCKPKELPWRAAGTDSSDGLFEAIYSLCESSNCQAVLNPKELPRDIHWPIGSHWDKWCLEGGEDFELIASLPPIWAKALVEKFPTSRIIGFMKSGPPKIMWSNGNELKKEKLLDFKHF